MCDVGSIRTLKIVDFFIPQCVKEPEHGRGLFMGQFRQAWTLDSSKITQKPTTFSIVNGDTKRSYVFYSEHSDVRRPKFNSEWAFRLGIDLYWRPENWLFIEIKPYWTVKILSRSMVRFINSEQLDFIPHSAIYPFPCIQISAFWFLQVLNF